VEAIRIIYRREADGWWAESPDVEGWSAAGDTYAAVVKLAEDGIPFALGQDAALEHYVPAAETPHLTAMIARGEVRPGNGTRYMPKPVKGRGSGKSASEYVSEGRR